ncbi:MAG: hypothetical protein LBI28_07600 [Treponema sp.]|jgi:hypothetical protein|nr:hypothetical protein [Treponema sp.]
MLWPGIKKLGKELGFKRTNSQVVGILKNCFVRMYDGKNMKILEIFSPEIDDTDKEYILNLLNQNKIKKNEWKNNGIIIIFEEYIRPYSIIKIKNILFTIVEHFEQKYPDAIPKCHKCGEQKNADVYSTGNTSDFLCSDCLRRYKNDLDREYLEYQQLPTNYLSGFIGALLFSIPGIIITVLLFLFLDRLAAVSAILYIVFGMKGYKTFKGKTSPLGALIIIAVGIIMIGIGILVAYSAVILRELKTFDIDLLIQILKMPEVGKELQANIIIAYTVSIFYIIIQLFQITREWKFSKNIQKARDI